MRSVQSCGMSYALQVFVSSTCHELRALRAAIREWLVEHGMTPMMSEEAGFPHISGMPPYATCLRALEECALVIGVIDRRYGTQFQDWGPYPQFLNCAPTHAELEHAIALGKQILIYVHQDVGNFYEVWRKNPEAFKTAAPAHLDEATLKMFHELKRHQPAPWITSFNDVADVLKSLRLEFVNQLYVHLRDQEKEAADSAAFLLKKITDAAPEVREKILAGLNPSLITERDDLQRRLSEIAEEFESATGTAREEKVKLAEEKAKVESQLGMVKQQLAQSSLLLARAAMKDVSWLDFIRRTMMPRQPGRVPFHHSAEVALRGYAAAAGGTRVTPILQSVSWSKLDYLEGGLHRGYHAGIIFRGSNFVPGITFTHRRRDEGLPTGNSDYFWRLPNIYFGDYLEVSTSPDEPESPLSWRDYEFQVKNPEGQTSEWILFTYPFDDNHLDQIRRDSAQVGAELLAKGEAAQAIEPLRKAYVFSDRMLGIKNIETLNAKQIWEKAREEAALAKLRFRPGVRLKVISGPEEGKEGELIKLMLNHVHAYYLCTNTGEEFQVADNQVVLLS